MVHSDQGLGAPSIEGFVLLGDVEPTVDEEGVESPQVVAEPTDPSLHDELEVPPHLLALDTFFTALEPIPAEQVVLTLTGQAAARLAGRAAYLGLMSPRVAARVAMARDWQTLLTSFLSPEQLALLVKAEPWLPPVRGEQRFCDWLVANDVLEREIVDALHLRSEELGWPIFQVAMDEQILDEARYVRELAQFYGLGLAKPAKRLSRSLLVRFPMGWVEHFDLVPLRHGDEGVQVAVTRALPDELMERLCQDAGGPVEQLLAIPASVASWRRRWLRNWWRLHNASWDREHLGPDSIA